MPESATKKILIIDDDPFIMDMYVLKFKGSAYHVDTAQDGKNGLKKIKEIQPDLILLDIVMPTVDGFDVLRELKKEKLAPLAKIVLLTNLGQKEDVERGMKLGADDYIIKAHFTPSEVLEKVKTLLPEK